MVDSEKEEPLSEPRALPRDTGDGFRVPKVKNKAEPDVKAKKILPAPDPQTPERKALLELASYLVQSGMALQKMTMDTSKKNTLKTNRALFSAVEGRVKLTHKRGLPKLAIMLNRAKLI